MKTSDIFENLQARIEFSDQVVLGLSKVLNDFAQSSHGSNYRTDSISDPRQATSQAHGGLDITTKSPTDGGNHCTGITVLAEGRVEIEASTKPVDGSEAEDAQYGLDFDPSRETAEDVVARTLACIMADPSELSEHLSAFINLKIGRGNPSPDFPRQEFDEKSLG